MKAAMDQTVGKLAAELAAHKEEGVVLKAELARMAPMVAQMELEKQVRSLLSPRASTKLSRCPTRYSCSDLHLLAHTGTEQCPSSF